MSRTLHHLLWSNLQTNPTGNGAASPSDHPEIGLPFRIAAKMLLEAFSATTSFGAIWSFNPSRWSMLVEGRLAQLGLRPVENVGEPLNELLSHAQSPWPIYQHPAYHLPLLYQSSIPPDWTNTLLFITAVSGSERILSQIFDSSPSSVPFQERWRLRSMIPMPIEVWNWIEQVLRAGRTGSLSSGKLRDSRTEVLKILRETFELAPLVLPDEFIAERVDVSLEQTTSPEVPCAVTRRALLANPAQEHFPLSRSKLNSGFVVRVAQATEEPNWRQLPSEFPNLNRKKTQAIRKQILRVFPTSSADGPDWDIAVFPEVFLPPSETGTFERVVRQSAKAGLIGCLWKVIRNAAPRYAGSSRIQFLANEALLVLPVGRQRSPQKRAVRCRSFFVRKPLPTHIEIAFARAVERNRGDGIKRHLLPGRRIYRFVHPRWGDFTVAICSDLIDPMLWASLRGQILHVLSCAYNRDVNLFDSLTWVRAYEMCANVVAVNCGHYGGSFAWSPRSGENKELARIRGNHLFVTADVQLPVSELAEWQIDGSQKIVDGCVSDWEGRNHQREKYKAPPPNFPHRTMLD